MQKGKANFWFEAGPVACIQVNLHILISFQDGIMNREHSKTTSISGSIYSKKKESISSSRLFRMELD